MRRFFILVFVFASGWLGGRYSQNWHDVTPPAPASSSSTTLPGVPIATPPVPSVKQDAVSEDKLLELLAAGRNEEAFALFMESDARTQETLRGTLLRQIGQIQQSGRRLEAERLLKGFLQAEFRDPQALWLLAENYHLQGHRIEALETLYKAKAYAYEHEDIESITLRLRKWVRQYETAMNNTEDHDGLVLLYEVLTRHEPDYPDHLLGLAKAQIANHDFASARTSLELIRHDAKVGDTARRLLFRLDGDTHETPLEGIPLVKVGNSYRVRAIINNNVELTLILDTGASLTAVKPEQLQLAGVGAESILGYQRFETANGGTEAPVYRVNSLRLGETLVTPIDVAALDGLAGLDVDGLLGMDFLGRSRFYIDQERMLLRLEPIADHAF